MIIFSLIGAFLSAAVGGFIVWTRAKSNMERRRSVMKDLDLARTAPRIDGWFSNYWDRAHQAARMRNDVDVHSEASSLLAGIDALPIAVSYHACSSAAFGPDGSVVVAGAEGGRAIAISATGAIRELPTNEEGPVAWTTGGKAAQLIGAANQLILQEVESGTALRVFNVPAGENIGAQTLSTDATFAAATVGQNTTVWTTDSEEMVGRIAMKATALTFSPDKKFLAAGDATGNTVIFSMPDLKEITRLPPPSRGTAIYCVAFGRNPVRRQGATSDNPWRLATGDQGATVVVWDIDKKVPQIFKGSTFIVSALAFSPDGVTLASAGRNQPRLWDIATGKLLLQLSETCSGAATTLAFDEDGNRLVTGGLAEGGNAMAALMQMQHDRGIKALRGLSSTIRKVWISSDGQKVAAISDDWQLGVWEVSRNRLLYTFEAPVGTYPDEAGGAFSVDAKTFIFASLRELCAYDLQTGEIAGKWTLPNGFANEVQCEATNDAATLVRSERQGSKSMEWRVYRVTSSAPPQLIKAQQKDTGSIETLALSPDAQWFVAGVRIGKNAVIRVYGINGRELWNRDITGASIFRFSISSGSDAFGYYLNEPDGDYLHVVNIKKSVEIGKGNGIQALAYGGGRYAGQFDVHFGVVNNLIQRYPAVSLTTDWATVRWVSAFSRDGKLLVWGSGQGVVLVADINEVSKKLSLLGR